MILSMALVMTLTVSRLPWLSPTLRAILAAAGMTATVACGGGGVTRGFVGTTTDDPESSAPVDPSAGIPGDDLPSSPPLTPIGAPAPLPIPAPAPAAAPAPAPAPPPAAPAPGGASSIIEIPDLTASPGTAPGQVILRFTAPTPQAQSYVVRASERPIETDADAAKAATVAHTVTPGAPGSQQTIVLSGLEEGQTLSFSVQSIRAGVSAPFGLAVASRVPEGSITAPSNAIRISAPGTLSQNGATYLLTQDVTSAGTAFEITGRDVTLDLGGHTVTYGTGDGTCAGVRSLYLYFSGKSTVRNGKLVQGGNGKSCPAIDFEGGHDIRLHHLELVVRGPDSNCIEVTGPSGETEIDHNVLRCDTKVVSNRHYPGVAAMYVADHLQSVRIHHNKILSSPQWGIKLQGHETRGVAMIHHNVVKGTKALVANGYMIGVYKPDVDVFENDLAGESRGIHVDCMNGSGDRAYVHDNALSVQDQLNPEYTTFHWVHGIKLEGPEAARIERNAVVGVADDAHAEVRALDVDFSGGKNCKVVDNRFTAIARTTKYMAVSFQWTGGSLSADPVDATVRRNVFSATDRGIVRSWGAVRGGLIDTNAFVRLQTLGSGQPYTFEFFDSSDSWAAPGHRVANPITTENVRAVGQWIGPAPFSSSREWTLSLLVVDGAGRPVEGAGVAVRDRQGAVAFTATSDAAGVASGLVVETIFRNGPVWDGRGPFTISVTKAGVGTVDGSVSVSGRTALRVDLGAKTVQVDTAAPAAPSFELARPVAGSRAALRWSVPTDASGIAAYQVFLDGVLVAIAEEPRAALAGLVPGATHVLTVKAIDRGGNVSAASSAVSIVMGADDRGF